MLSGGTTSFQGIFEIAPSLPMFLHELNAGAASFVEVLACRNSLMRKWRHCTFLHSVRPSPSVPRNTQITLVSSLKALLLSAVEFLFVCCDFVSFATAARGPLKLDSAKKHHTLLMELDEKVANNFPAFRANLNVLDTLDASTTSSTQRAQKAGNAWKTLSRSFTNGESGDHTRSPHSVQSSPSLVRNKQFLEVSRLKALSGDGTATHHSLRLVRTMVLGH